MHDGRYPKRVYGALTWEKAEPRHNPPDAAQAVRLLVEPPSAIVVLSEGLEVALQALRLAAAHGLTARRVHDARHAAAAMVAEVAAIPTDDVNDWKVFESDGLRIVGPPTTLALVSQKMGITWVVAKRRRVEPRAAGEDLKRRLRIKRGGC